MTMAASLIDDGPVPGDDQGSTVGTSPAATGAKPTRARVPAVIWILLGANLLVRSAGFAYPFMAFHVAGRGHGAHAVSLVLAAFGVGWVVGQLVCGGLVDRVGCRSTLVVTMGLSTVVLMALAGAETFSTLLIGAALAGAVFDALRPVTGAIVTALLPEPEIRARVDAWRFAIVVNVGAGIAGGVGAMLADLIGTPGLFVINSIACAVVAAIGVWCLPRDRVQRMTSSKASYRQALRDIRLVLLFFSSVATLTTVIGLYAVIPLLMTAHGMSASAYSLVLVVDAVAITALTPLITPWLSRRVAVRARLDIMAAAAGWALVSMAAAAFARNTVSFSVAVAAIAPAVIAWFVVAADILHRIAPPAQLGRYHGLWGSALAVAAVVAPVLGSASLISGGTQLVGATTAAVGAIGVALCLPLARVIAPR
ncbi:hypothetical protein A5641_10400 [Mycobacterium sp. 1554424.7]|nr:hypothetical protein A5641_10400 [Mycobacterium sp. 1554424.7]